MIYCAVDEAFDNSLRNQMRDYDEKNNLNDYKKALHKNVKNYRQQNNIIPPDTFDNYSDIDIGNSKQQEILYPAFFTAQGDYSSKGPYYGTTISDLKNQNDDISTISDNIPINDMDSDFSESEYIPKKKQKREIPMKPFSDKFIDHSYYVDKFIKNLDPETLSMGSTIDNTIYKHVKSCKYCKSKINQNYKLINGKLYNYKRSSHGFGNSRKIDKICINCS